MERIGKSHYNNALSRSLISYAALALICNIVSWYDVCYLVRIHREDAPVVLGIVVISLICLGAATIFFVFKILRSIIDMEKKIERYQDNVEKDNLKLAKDFYQFQQENIEALKKFL